MEQKEINIEKQELMERIKEVYENSIWPKNKWWRIAQTIFLAFFPFVILYDRITEGTFGLEQSIYLAFCIIYAILLIAVDYRRFYWSKRVLHAETAQDLLEATDRDTRENKVCVSVMLVIIAAFVLSKLLINHEMMWAVIVAVLAVALIALMIFVKPRQGKDINRLRELVKQDEEKSEASV